MPAEPKKCVMLEADWVSNWWRNEWETMIFVDTIELMHRLYSKLDMLKHGKDE